MAQKTIKKRHLGDNPPVNFTDLSYIMPLLCGAPFNDRTSSPVLIDPNARATVSLCSKLGRLPLWYSYENMTKQLMLNRYEADDLRSTEYTRWTVKQYPHRPYDFIIIAPPIGSVAYLSAMLEAPVLPLNYSVRITHDRFRPDDLKTHSEQARKYAEPYLKKDPDIEIIHEYDPIHDRFSEINGTALRFRFTRLPKHYTDFIKTNLKPGGTILFIESRTGWRQFLSPTPQFFHQIGRFSGIPCDEFIQGSKRIGTFLEQFLLDSTQYKLPYRHDILPESRYGVVPAMRREVINTAHDARANVLLVANSDIYQISRLATQLFITSAFKDGTHPLYCYIHTGSFINPQACMQTSTIPIWLPAPSPEAFDFASDIINSYSYDLDEILIALEPTVVKTPDYVDIRQWAATLKNPTAINMVGATHKNWYRSTSAMFRYWPEVNRWAARRKEPLDFRPSLDNIIEGSESCGATYQFVPFSD